MLAEALDALRRDRAIESAVATVHLPFWWPLARAARERFGWPVVYDLMDDHAGFSSIMPHTLEQEGALLESADLVVATSGMLEAQARRRSSNVVLVRNGCDYDHFSRAGTSRPIEPAKTSRPVIGYVGAVADWFDADLVADLAARRPEWDFVLVGSTHSGDVTRLAALPNVSLPGEKPYAEIPGWLARFDVAIVPFKRLPLTEATNPVKAYEYLAAGKPLVSVPLPEMRALGDLVRLADDAAGFEAEIVAAMSEKGDRATERRRAFARENTWQRRFEALDAAIKPLLRRRDDAIGADGTPDEDPLAALLAAARRAASGNGSSPRRLFLLFSGTTFTESEGQRPTRLARELARRGIVVAFVYWRWDRTPPRQSQSFPQVVQIPIDTFLEHYKPVLASPEMARFDRVFLMEFPHPSLWRMVNLANAYGWRTVYDVIDDWEEFQKVGQADWYSPSVERYLVDNADLTAVTCDALEEKVARMSEGRARVVRLANAIEADAFSPPEAPAAVARGDVTVGYFGHLTDAWFDWDLVTALARRRPLWKFHLIGYGQPGGLGVPPNVLLLGKVEHRMLPAYAANWDVAIIPFRPSALSRAVDPIKVYEYLALGLPTVAAGMPHLGTYPGVLTAEGVDEVEAAIAKAAGGRPDAGIVREFLSRNHWGARVDGLLAALADARNVSPVTVALGLGAATPAMANAG
jgi:glycosyltransferase involved in cell wall biosynthesis